MVRKTPSIAVDAIVEKDEKILLIKRKNQPYRGQWALPGGFVDYGECVEDALKREVREETNLEVIEDQLFGVYSDPSRDPRGHVISICFKVNCNGILKGGDDAEDARFFSKNEISSLELAFDHNRIINDYRSLNNYVL